ncbi:hypothetical protein RCZ04_21280 [Capnocytophaga sp. HP1101]
MIEKDYLKRQIDRFFEELTALLSKKPAKEEQLKQLNYLTEKYTPHTLTYFINTPTETILSAYKDSEDTLEIISEILFLSSDDKTTLQKTADIIEYLNHNSKEYSFRRNNNLEEIKHRL